MVYPLDMVEAFRKYTGGKTLNLNRLKLKGFNIPATLFIPSSVILSNKSETSYKKSIKSLLPATSYAVRSSALIEDGERESHAGKFCSILDVPIEELDQAIAKVVSNAEHLLSSELSGFSIIIQEFIPFDFSGVVFTRNPLGGREMVVEYTKGTAEELVSGKIIPKRVSFYHNSYKLDPQRKRFLKPLIEQCIKMESYFDFPQDIEWGVKNNVLYFVQARPITSLEPEHFKIYLFLDRKLPDQRHFFLQKTEVAEDVPKAFPIMTSLLDLLYAPDGPIARMYKRYKIPYYARKIISTVGNEVYVDLLKEARCLFPAMGFDYYKHRMRFLVFSSGIGRMLRNIGSALALNRISLTDKKKTDFLEFLLKQLRVQEDASPPSINGLMKDFLENFSVIYEINLLAAKCIKSFEILFRKYPVSLTKILSESPANPSLSIDFSAFRGNSINITDLSDFKPAEFLTAQEEEAEQSLTSLPPAMQSLFLKKVKELKEVQYLRELGRWVNVKHISRIRRYILQLGEEEGLKNPEDIFFCSLEEISIGQIVQSTIKRRKIDFNSQGNLHLPVTLSSIPPQKEKGLLNLSDGVAEGILVTSANLDQYDAEEKKILYTQVLSPELTEYFPKISGILSDTGSLLSHLAIVAREEGIPVISNVDMARISIKPGDRIKMDSRKREVNRL